MTSNFEITYGGVGPVTRNCSSYPVAQLSYSDLTLCFPCDVTFCGDKEVIVFEDAPLLGLVADFSFLWRETQRGNRRPTAPDVYDSYVLALSCQGSSVAIEEERTGKSILIEMTLLNRVGHAWANNVFANMEQKYPEIAKVDDYVELKRLVVSAWSGVLREMS